VSEAALRIDLWVESNRWREVGSLDSAGTSDNVFVIDRDSGMIMFGDGVHGRRPPLGSEVVVATYEHGAGSSGHEPSSPPPIQTSRPDLGETTKLALWTVIRADTRSIPFPGVADSRYRRHGGGVRMCARGPVEFVAGCALGLLIGISSRHATRHRA
jgi:hypothetical protein